MVHVLTLLLSVVLPVSALAQVVINEVLYDPDGSDAGFEFVEVANCGREAVLLSGWVLETGNGASPDDWTVEWIGGDFDRLEPGEILPIGESGVEPTPAYVTPLDLQNGPDGVRITDGQDVVDVVGWGEPLFLEYYEGRPAVDAPSGSSLARSPDCFDHDDNALDFVPCSTPTPGLRNVLETDLAIRARHAGPVVLDGPAPVVVDCLIRNEGSLAVDPEDVTVRLSIEGHADPVSVLSVERRLEPRDSVAVELRWESPTDGYHRATATLLTAGDENASNDTAETTFTVLGSGGGARARLKETTCIWSRRQARTS